MQLINNETLETITEDASPELRSAACDSDSPVLAWFSESRERWELLDPSQESTMRMCRPEPRIVAVYGLP